MWCFVVRLKSAKWQMVSTQSAEAKPTVLVSARIKAAGSKVNFKRGFWPYVEVAWRFGMRKGSLQRQKFKWK
jgi:hypothetical protein